MKESMVMAAQAASSTILMGEHDAIKRVLERQDLAIAALERGVPVDAAIFADLHLFFSLFVGKCHHGKEEQLLFPVLRRSTAMAPSIDRLETEHRQGLALVAAYDEAQRRYAGQGMVAAPDLIAAAQAYAQFLRQHIAVENERVLEQAGTVTSAPEEAEIVAAFERFEEDVMGKGTHERLHAMIDTLGPRLDVYA
jgi:hemerythrin-like domain-containing protein